MEWPSLLNNMRAISYLDCIRNITAGSDTLDPLFHIYRLIVTMSDR